MTDMQIEQFIQGYITAALWSTNDESTPCGGVPLDENYGLEDISVEAMVSIREDCLDFIQMNTPDLIEYVDERGVPANWAGHDFWLTRCGHGTGFWDRGLGDLGERLSEAAKVYGDCWMYVGDDGQVYV